MTAADYDPATINSRLLIPFTVAGNKCLTAEADTIALPWQLAARGVTQEEWDGVASELAAMQQSQVGICAGALMICSVVLIPVYCVVRCHNQALLDTWLERLNSAHLQPRGMLARYQSLTVPHGTWSTVESWLAIAFTPEDSAQLAAEPAWESPSSSC